MVPVDASTTGLGKEGASNLVKGGKRAGPPEPPFRSTHGAKASILAILVFTIVLRAYSLLSRKSFEVGTNSEVLLAYLPSSARPYPAYNTWPGSLQSYTS